MKVPNIIKNKRTITILISAICVILLIGSTAFAIQQKSKMKSVGQQQKDIYAAANANDSVATVDGIPITKKAFDTFKVMYSNSDQKPTDKEVLDMIVERQLLHKQAEKEGITISDEQLNNAIEKMKQDLHNDTQSYSDFKDYIAGLNITEEQYWEQSKPVYKKALAVGQLKSRLKQQYEAEHKSEDAQVVEKNFGEFYKSYVSDLKQKVKIDYKSITK